VIDPAVFYFLLDVNNAQIQPITDQPSNQLPMRILVISVLSFLVCWARYAGAQNTMATNAMATTYFTNITIFIFILKTGGSMPPNISLIYIPYFADLSSSSSILNNWLYFAIRSVRDIDPVLIWPAFVATAMSAMVVSSVSPLRCETMTP